MVNLWDGSRLCTNIITGTMFDSQICSLYIPSNHCSTMSNAVPTFRNNASRENQIKVPFSYSVNIYYQDYAIVIIISGQSLSDHNPVR